MRDDPVNERWKRLVALTTQFLKQESPADRDRRMKTAMAKARGRYGNWRAVVSMTHGIIALRRQANSRGAAPGDAEE